jgi:uncharacterized protein with gpF-like domain
MKAVKRGEDLALIERELSEGYGITERRARFIARDHTPKVNAALSLENSRAVGISRGTWMHHATAKVYRKEHVEMDGREFNLNEGLYDRVEGRNVMPGELYGCNCTYRNLVPSLEDLVERGLIDSAEDL